MNIRNSLSNYYHLPSNRVNQPPQPQRDDSENVTPYNEDNNPQVDSDRSGAMLERQNNSAETLRPNDISFYLQIDYKYYQMIERLKNSNEETLSPTDDAQ